MKIVITGASGFVAGEIIPYLREAGAEMVLAGRDAESLSARYPDAVVTGYDGLAAAGRGADALVHLAVMNNDHPGGLDAFRTANVTFLDEVLDAAKAADISKVILASTLHAEDSRRATPYGQSKAEAEALLNDVKFASVRILRLGAVYGKDYRGKLALLKKLPAFLRSPAFNLLSSLRPTTHASLVAAAVIESSRAEAAADEMSYVTDAQAGNPVYHWTKRAIDVIVAVALVACFFWLFLGIWFAVRATSKGPGLFAQERVGQDGRSFTCYKFRTMHEGTQQVGTHELTTSAVTPLGSFLRRTKLDELPQVINLLRNEMSLIGPRPCLPVQEELIQARAARGVYQMKPGISGLAQINDIDMSSPELLARADQRYLYLRSLPLDLKIMVATSTGRGQADRVRDA